MDSQPHIVIVGGSLAGLTLALACASRGVPVHVVERAAERLNGGDSLSVSLAAIAATTGHDPRVYPKLAVVPAYRDRHLTTWPALYAWLRGRALETPGILLDEGKTVMDPPSDRSAVQSGSGCDSNPLSMRLLGVSGVGKSFSMRAYAGEHRPVEEPERTRMPVVYLKVPSAPTRKSIYLSFLNGMRRRPGNATTDDLQGQADVLAKNCGVELLLVDEIHHFIDRGAANSYATAADALKELIDLIGVPVVFAGAPRSQILFGHNSQLRTRVMTVHRLKPFHPDQDLPTLRGFIYALTANLREEDQAWLSNEDNAVRIFFATDGLHRGIATFLKLVCRWARKGNALDDSLLAGIFGSRIWKAPAIGLDPFHPKFVMRRLNRRGEPFEPTYLDGDNHAVDELDEVAP